MKDTALYLTNSTSKKLFCVPHLEIFILLIILNIQGEQFNILKLNNYLPKVKKLNPESSIYITNNILFCYSISFQVSSLYDSANVQMYEIFKAAFIGDLDIWLKVYSLFQNKRKFLNVFREKNFLILLCHNKKISGFYISMSISIKVRHPIIGTNDILKI